MRGTNVLVVALVALAVPAVKSRLRSSAPAATLRTRTSGRRPRRHEAPRPHPWPCACGSSSEHTGRRGSSGPGPSRSIRAPEATARSTRPVAGPLAMDALEPRPPGHAAGRGRSSRGASVRQPPAGAQRDDPGGRRRSRGQDWFFARFGSDGEIEPAGRLRELSRQRAGLAVQPGSSVPASRRQHGRVSRCRPVLGSRAHTTRLSSGSVATLPVCSANVALNVCRPPSPVAKKNSQGTESGYRVASRLARPGARDRVRRQARIEVRVVGRVDLEVAVEHPLSVGSEGVLDRGVGLELHPYPQRFQYTPAIIGRSSATRASSSTIEASVTISSTVRPRFSARSRHSSSKARSNSPTMRRTSPRASVEGSTR